MVVRPNGYAIWEKIQKEFNKYLKKKNVKNAYFPLLIPDGFFKKEAKHAEGFAPELAYVKGTEDGELLALRPTSETIIYDSYSKWVRSWRDLPLLMNQWANVVRWEVKQTKPFIRTREFLWQEGHCAFSNFEDAENNMVEIIKEYKKLVEDLLAIPVLVGRKSEMEKFPGAETTMTIEALMPDGKSLQSGTSHNLGQGFAKVFDIKFKDKNEKDKFVWQTSWGFSTRLIGALIMVHGDDKGLVLPPKIAKNKCVIVPILMGKNKENVFKKSVELKKKLAKFNAILDNRDYSPGWKFNEWEMKGIPVRVEVGPRDLEKKEVTLVRRDNGEKIQVSEKKAIEKINELLKEIQENLFAKAKKFLDSRIDEAKDMKELKKKLKEGKIVKAYFVNDKNVEKKIKEELGATTRFVEEGEGVCVKTGELTKTIGWFAKSY